MLKTVSFPWKSVWYTAGRMYRLPCYPATVLPQSAHWRRVKLPDGASFHTLKFCSFSSGPKSFRLPWSLLLRHFLKKPPKNPHLYLQMPIERPSPSRLNAQRGHSGPPPQFPGSRCGAQRCEWTGAWKNWCREMPFSWYNTGSGAATDGPVLPPQFSWGFFCDVTGLRRRRKSQSSPCRTVIIPLFSLSSRYSALFIIATPNTDRG